jgi:anti-sigma regulatory factor (Ser/Thr protein kinase)
VSRVGDATAPDSEDDMTTFSPQPPASDPVTLALPFSAESAAVARHRLRDWLRGLGAGAEQLDDARLVVSELVGNAIRHARPLADDTLRVEWDRHDTGLDIAVTDGGSVSNPERLDAAVSDLAGRGLAIVDTLATRWWVEATRSRTTVHARVDLP